MCRTLKSIYCTVSLAALATPAFAQTAPSVPVDTTPQKTQESPTVPAATTNAQGQTARSPGGESIVVTGSRIRRSTFTTPSPVTIVTREDRVLAGSSSTAEVLQSSTVTSGTAQINGAFLGFVSEGGPAASTIGLRGLSASRTLVLLNGRRLAPAGGGPQLIAADLNTLPTNAVQRVEVLREGASSVYGSDAIAGVVNVITDTSVNGITIDGYARHPLYGVGDALRGSIVAGKTFSRGHIMATFEYRNQEGVRVGDRADFACPRELLFDNGVETGSIDPATGQPSCFGYTLGTGAGIASGYGIANTINTTSGAAGGTTRITFSSLTDPNTQRLVNGTTRVSPSPTQLLDHVISPVRTYTGYVNGAYELGILGDAEIYGEGLWTRRTSHQDFTPQLSLSLTELNPTAIAIYGPGTPATTGPVSPFFPTFFGTALTAAQPGGPRGIIRRFTPFIVPDQESQTKQRVDYLRTNGGIRGHLPFADWRYDANLQYSKTRGTYSVTGIERQNLTNVLQPVLAPAGTPADVVTVALPGQVGAGNSYTCASNLTGGVYNGGTCVPLNLYDPNVFIGGHIPQNVYDYLYRDYQGKSNYDQWTFEANADGTLAQLPGGALKAAVGFVHRTDKIVDTPSAAARSRQLYNYSSSDITRGKDTVNEVYGELDVPIFRDRPFANLLELQPSARYTHYKSEGSALTYHINAQYAPISAVRFRGNYGTNFRAPNLYELFVNGISGFYGSNADPCSQFGGRSPSTPLYQNCLATLTPILDNPATPVNEALAFVATAGPKVFTVGNASGLKPEKATTYGFGMVLTAPRRVADLTLAVDYYHIKVKDELTTIGTTILRRCYEATDFPNNQYCNLIAPRLPAGNSQQGNLDSFQNPFFNVSNQTVSGIDFNVRYATPVMGGRFVAELEATRNLHQYYKLFSDDDNFDYVGTLGVQGFAAGPKWTGDLDLRFTTANDITFRWGINYVGRQTSRKVVGEFDNCFGTIGRPAPGATFVGCLDGDLTANVYITHGASVRWNWRNVGQFTIGMNNVFNRKPPIISTYGSSAGSYPRIGNYFNSSNYDFLGRSIFANVTKTFK